MASTRIIPTLTSPQLLDRALAYLQTHLETKISWLDKAYGKCELHIQDGKRLPRVYAGAKEYITLNNDERLNNFSFFNVTKGNTIVWRGMQKAGFKDSLDIILFWDYEDVYGANHETYSIENIKQDVITALRSFAQPLIRFEPISFDDVNPYAPFSVDTIIRPYGALKVSGLLTYDEKC